MQLHRQNLSSLTSDVGLGYLGLSPDQKEHEKGLVSKAKARLAEVPCCRHRMFPRGQNQPNTPQPELVIQHNLGVEKVSRVWPLRLPQGRGVQMMRVIRSSTHPPRVANDMCLGQTAAARSRGL